MAMEKKRVWMVFCTVMIILMTCTVLSLRIENLMKLRVDTCSVIKDEKLTLEFQNSMKEQVGLLRLSCYQWDEDSEYKIYYAEKREGLFGKEYVAAKKSVYVFEERDNKAVVRAEDALDEDGKSLKIISGASCSRDIREGDLLIIDEEDMVNPVRQIQIIACLAAILLPGILLLIESVKKLGHIQEGNWKTGIEGMIFVVIWLCSIFWLTGKLQIPRQYLPSEYIFDIPFYVNEWKELQIWSIYKKELFAAGSFILLVWGATVAAGLYIYRKNRNR